jgi:hypothetical protein
VKPLEYYGRGDRAVIVGDETFEVKATGVTHRAHWVWVVDVRDGLITRIAEIQHLSKGVAEPIRESSRRRNHDTRNRRQGTPHSSTPTSRARNVVRSATPSP